MPAAAMNKTGDAAVLTYERVLRAVERYGYGLTLAAALLWFVRSDIIKPMVASHQQFVAAVTSSQAEIAVLQKEQRDMLAEQNRLLTTLLEEKIGGE